MRLASRAGHRCSNPSCRRDTSGPESTADGSVNIGVASHITAAAPGGPRFDPLLSPAERASIANGIWLCQWCGKLIDSDEARYTKAVVLAWKASAEALAGSLLETPAEPQGTDDPKLVLPASDPAVSWLAFSSRATTFVGRDDERAAMEKFLRSDRKFSWWLLTGAAGTGKSRLALEICRDARPGWGTGFLSRTEEFGRWSNFRPAQPTLIVIDYVASRATFASAAVLQLTRSASHFPNPVRVLLLERDQGSWWPRFRREDSQSEGAEIVASQHDEPLHLGPLSPAALRSIAADVARSQQTRWSASVERRFKSRMRTLDPLGRPLFGMIAAAFPGSEATDVVADSAVLRLVLKREAARRERAIPDDERRQKMENLVALATFVGGLLPRAGGFAFLSGSDVASLVPVPEFIDPDVYRDVTASTSGEAILAGLQPDILGERFVLDRLTGGGGAAEAARRLLSAGWALQPDDLCDFVVRTASDFPGDAGLDVLCALPLASPEARGRWGRLVGDLVRVANRSTDSRSQRLLGVLRELAQRRAGEAEIQRALARAELYLGNVFLFVDKNFAQSGHQFDAAIALAGADSAIGAAAINNRGILHNEVKDEDRAFSDWSEVIAKAGIPDEARACSLNNRADIFARRGAHENAVRDRSAVLALRETSADRRYIALIRRSGSHFALRRPYEALSDLDAILRTEDITAQQKSQARVARGVVYRELRQFCEARNDLETVLDSEELFPGTIAEALVELGELARREGDPDRARAYLDDAATSSDARDSTLVEALIVRAKILTDAGDAIGAKGIWQSLLSNPSATERQRKSADFFLTLRNIQAAAGL